jgi:hypothetical protein
MEGDRAHRPSKQVAWHTNDDLLPRTFHQTHSLRPANTELCAFHHRRRVLHAFPILCFNQQCTFSIKAGEREHHQHSLASRNFAAVHTPLNKDDSLLSAVFGNSLSHQKTQSPIHLLHQRPHPFTPPHRLPQWCLRRNPQALRAMPAAVLSQRERSELIATATLPWIPSHAPVRVVVSTRAAREVHPRCEAQSLLLAALDSKSNSPAMSEAHQPQHAHDQAEDWKNSESPVTRTARQPQTRMAA